jgi:hypothetical protein
MKLGLLTAPFPDTALMELADWAAGAGFEALEIACWPQAGGETRRYAGTSHIDVDGMTPDRAGEMVAALTSKGLTVSGLGYYPNPLHAEAEHRERVIGHLRKMIAAAALMKVPVVNTFVGGDRTLPLEENWKRAEAIWPEIVAHARDHGVTLAFENCPMIFSQDEWPGGHNIAYPRRSGGASSNGKAWDELRPLAPRLADDRPGPLHPRVRPPHGPRPCQGPPDRPRRPLRERHHVPGHGLAGAADARPGRGGLAHDLPRAHAGGLRRPRRHRARGPPLRGNRGQRPARISAGPGRASAYVK